MKNLEREIAKLQARVAARKAEEAAYVESLNPEARAAWDKLQAASIAVWKAYKGLLKGDYPALVAAERSAKSEWELVRPLPKKREE